MIHVVEKGNKAAPGPEFFSMQWRAFQGQEQFSARTAATLFKQLLSDNVEHGPWNADRWGSYPTACRYAFRRFHTTLAGAKAHGPCTSSSIWKVE